MKSRKKVLLAKPEITYGVDPVPTGAANAIQVNRLEVTPLNADYLKRGILRPTLGSERQLVVGAHVLLEADVEVAGAGAAGTAPAWGVLHRGCGCAETITAGTSVVYAPVSANEESLALWFHLDGNRHKLAGARGTWSLDLSAKGVPLWKYQFVGLLVAPDAATLPAVDLSAFKDPLPVSKINTPTFTVHGYAGALEQLTLAQGNQLVHRDLVNSQQVLISDRQSSGSLTMEAPLISAKDFFAAASAATLGALQLTHGTVAGNIVQIDAPKLQVTNPRYGDSDGIATLQLDLNFVPDAGDDEWAITVK